MRIERVRVCGFGTLRDVDLDLEGGGAQLIIAPNEAGKSTLLAAIETALFGFPDRRTAEGRAARAAFRPWSGGASWVELTIEHGGRRCVVRFEILDPGGAAVERWTVTCDGQDRTDRMQREAGSPGLWLTGLSRDDFARTALVRQGELEAVADDPGQLVHHLERIVTSSTHGGSAAEAIALLEAALDEYRERAGLAALAEGVLERARQWSRVRAALQRRIDALRQERMRLERRRAELESALEALERQEQLLTGMRQMRTVLGVLHDETVAAQLRSMLEADEAVAGQIAALDAQLAELDDVAGFDFDRSAEAAKALERLSQRRSQADALRAEIASLDETIARLEAQIRTQAALAPLVAQLEPLADELALYREADQELTTLRTQEQQPLMCDIGQEGLSAEAIQQAYDRLHQLPAEQRRFLKDYPRQRRNRRETLRNCRDSTAVAAEQIAAIRRQRQWRSLSAWLCGVVSLVLAATSGWGIALLGGSVAMAWGVAGAIGMLGVALAVGLGVSARRFRQQELADAETRHRQQRDDAQRLEEQLAEDAGRLESLASELGLSAEALLAEAALLEAHTDTAEKLRDLRFKLDSAMNRCSRHARRWAEWFRQAARDVPEPMTPAAAQALYEQVQRLAELEGLRRRNLDRRAELEAKYRAALDSVLETQNAVARLLRAVAGFEIPLRTDRPIEAEALDALRQRFDAQLQRARQRGKLLSERSRLTARRLDPQRRAQAQTRLETLRSVRPKLTPETIDAPGLDRPPPLPDPLDDEARAAWLEAVVAWLRQCDVRLQTQLDLERWDPATLAPEQVAEAQRRLTGRIDTLQQQHSEQTQQGRAFLAEYARRMPELDEELSRLEQELHRGRRFAEAITLARDALQAVQHESHERWAAMLSAALGPQVERLLPDYRLESIEPDLSIVLLHRPTRTRLDAGQIRLHLSRGARDRLLLSLRLALVEVLTGDGTLRLPLLLDDVLAHCDDERFAAGLEMLGELAAEGWCVLLVTCQQSRAETLMPPNVASAWHVVEGLSTCDATERVRPG